MKITIKLQPKQKEAYRLSLTTPVLFYGGAKGGGKSHLIRAKEMILRIQNKGTKGLIVRKTYPELLSNHIRKLFEEYPETKDWYNKSEKAIYYPNGSITEFSYLKNTDDVYTYQGREYDNISIDEITQHEEAVFKILRSSLRTTKEGFKPTMLLTGNPGGIGHQWVKRLFVDQKYRENEDGLDYSFVQAKVQDNIALLKADPDYVKRLQDLPDHLRRAYLDGDWNIFAGLAFSELTSSLHVIDPIELPPETRYFASFDPGYNHPFSFIIFAVVPEGTVYVVQHYSDRLKVTREIYEGMLEHARGRQLQVYSGHDLWYPGRGGGPSQHEEFLQLGAGKHFTFIQANTDRKQGVNQIRKYVNPRNYPDGKPRLFFFKNCSEVFDAVASMQIDPKNPEDVLKMDADEEGYGGDDAYDSFRMGIMSRAHPNRPQDKEPVYGSGDWLMRQIEEAREYEMEVSDY